MMWPTAAGQDAFVDFSARTLIREDSELDASGEIKPEQDQEKDKEKEKNNKEGSEKEIESSKKEPDLRSMKDRIKLRTGVFRRHLTEYIKDKGSSGAGVYEFESEDNHKCIVWDDKGRIKHATLLKLVEKLTSDKHTDTPQIFVFLQTYRTFITPKKLFDVLIARYTNLILKKEVSPEELDTYDRTIRRPTRLRILVIFKYWIEQYFLDWDENPELEQPFRDFLKNDVLPYGLTNLCEQILRILDKTIQEKQKAIIQSTKVEHVTKFDISVFDFWGFSAKEIAMHLTARDFHLFKAIKPYEFLGLAWTKKDGKKRAPNVLAAIAGFNKLVEWLRTEILMEDSLKDRVARLSKILDIANEFYLINNFNGLVEIIATLESSSVARLKKTWAALSPEHVEIFDNMKKMVSQDKNFMKYREKLHKIEPPCVPYLGVYLTDLVFIDEGNPDTYGEMINFFKCGMISSVIREIQQYQQMPYSFVFVHMFQKYVDEFHGFSEKISYDTSLELEPRTTIATEEEFGDVGQTPQQYVMYGRVGKNKVLNYSEDPFDVQLLLLGTFSPITVRLPPKCNAQQALEIFENNMHGVNSNSALVVHPKAQILDRYAFLSDYSANKKDILVIQSDPQVVRVGISHSKTMQQIKDMILDFSSPLFCMMPLFQVTFNMKEEIAFLYVEGYSVARWLNIHKTIAEQACDPSVGFILIYPLKNIIHKEPPKLDSVDKSGYLSIRQLNSKGFKFDIPKRRFVILQDHFLVFCKHNDLLPYKALCLEHFKAKLGNDQTITLTRSFKGFASSLIKSTTIVLMAQPEEDISDWFAIMQRNCGIIGDQTVFGIDLASAAGKRGKNSQIPSIVEISLLYLFSGEKKWDNLFNAPANPILLEYYKRLFDQGVNVEFSSSITDPYTVAQLILSYLDELPAPLLTYELYEEFVSYGAKSFENETDLIAELQNLIAKIPTVNKAVLCLLLLYLHKSGGDRLGLSLALGPVLLKSGNPSKTNDESKACSLVVIRLISHEEKIFSGAKEGAVARKILQKNLSTRTKKAGTFDGDNSQLPPNLAQKKKGVFRKFSSLTVDERQQNAPVDQPADPNLTKTIINRYLDLDASVSLNKDNQAQAQPRTARSNSGGSSFTRGTLSTNRTRGDSDGIKKGAPPSLAPSRSASPVLSSSQPSYGSVSPALHCVSPLMLSAPAQGAGYPAQHDNAAQPKRANSELNVVEKLKKFDRNSTPDLSPESQRRASPYIHSYPPSTKSSTHTPSPAHRPPSQSSTQPSAAMPPLDLSSPLLSASLLSSPPPFLAASILSPPLPSPPILSPSLLSPPPPPSSPSRMNTIGRHFSRLMVRRGSKPFIEENSEKEKEKEGKDEKEKEKEEKEEKEKQKKGEKRKAEKQKKEGKDKKDKKENKRTVEKDTKENRLSLEKDKKEGRLSVEKDKKEGRLSGEKDKKENWLSAGKEKKENRLSSEKDKKENRLSAGKDKKENRLSAGKDKKENRLSAEKDKKENWLLAEKDKREGIIQVKQNDEKIKTSETKEAPIVRVEKVENKDIKLEKTEKEEKSEKGEANEFNARDYWKTKVETAGNEKDNSFLGNKELKDLRDNRPRGDYKYNSLPRRDSNEALKRERRKSRPSPRPSRVTAPKKETDAISSVVTRINRIETNGTDYRESPILKKVNNQFCAQCGEKFASDARFCGSCGHAR